MQFEVPSHNSRLLWYVLVMALLVHFGMMMIFVMHYDTGTYTILRPRDVCDIQQQNADVEAEQSNDVWVNRKAAPSQFGAPVVFYDEPEQAEAMCDEQAEDTLHEIDSLEQDVPKHVENEATNPQEYAQGVSNDASHQETSQDQSIDQQAMEASKKDSEQPGNTPIAVDAVEQDMKKTPNSEQARQEQHAPSPKLMRQDRVKSKKAPIQQGAAQQRNKVTLAQLAQGFLQYAQQEEGGDALLEVRGGRDGVPTDEQLKHERYWQKIAWCMQREFRTLSIAQHEMPSIPFEIGWNMLLNRDGSIYHLELLISSGNGAFDERYARTIHAASTAFPPVPSFFKGPVYQIRFRDRGDARNNASRVKFSAH